jgi:spore coat polysaccharide biosynthesis protein SpsF
MRQKRIGITLQALMRSTRLRRKPMLQLCGREMIAHQIDRLKTAKIPQVLILCTSTSDEDKVLVDLAKREGIEAFTGPKEDVLSRLTMAAEKYDLDYIIAPAGDNPLTCAEHIDILAELLVANDLDYADGVDALPIGMFAKGVKKSALKKACEIKAEEDTEAWMAYFKKTTGLFKVGKIKALSWVIDKDVRLTVDTSKDFELMKKIFEKFYKLGEVFSLAEVLMYLKENPEVASINKDIVQLLPEHFPFAVKSEYQIGLKV